jgi:DNA-binding response OmpR family regulator
MNHVLTSSPVSGSTATVEPGISLFKLNLSGPKGSVRLTMSEAMLLQAFVQSPNKRLAFDVMAEILGIDFDELAKASIQVRMVRLRKKMHSVTSSGVVIQAIRNVGYQLFEPISI